jgi:UDP-N-acetyl-D-glucosamine dehydrogenase
MKSFSSMKQELLNRIENRTVVLSVVGMGYVGLPLAVEFAEAGFRVITIDVDTREVESINRGGSYIEDVPTSRLKPLVESEKQEGRAANDSPCSLIRDLLLLQHCQRYKR